MVRIYKEYNLALHSKEIVQKRVVSSSYPGELSSDDGAAIKLTTAALLLQNITSSHIFRCSGHFCAAPDFYISDTGLALLQTTNDILDTELYKQLTPHSLLNWQRVRCAISWPSGRPM